MTYTLQRVTTGAKEACSFIIGEPCGDVPNPTHEWEPTIPPKTDIIERPPIDTQEVRSIHKMYAVSAYTCCHRSYEPTRVTIIQ